MTLLAVRYCISNRVYITVKVQVTRKTTMSRYGILACVLMVMCVHREVQGVDGPDRSVCTPAAKPVVPPPPAMTTTKLLSLNVEWRETRTKRTYNILEYYDDERMLGVLNIQLPPQENVKILFDYSQNVAMVMELPTSQSDSTICSVVKMGPQMFYYNDKPWLTSLTLLYRSMIGSKDTEYVSNSSVTTLRSYPVQEWRACMFDYYSNLTSQVRIFFSDGTSGWITPHLPPGEPQLVSMMIYSKQHSKSSTTEFNVIGDILDFTPYPTFPSDAFVTPPGVYCPGRPRGPPLPRIANSFYMSKEVVTLHTITFHEIYYDYSAKRIRHDTKSALGNDPNPMSTVYNFVTGVRYEKDMFLGSCNVDTIQAGDDYTALTSNNFITMQNVSEVFHFDKASIQYAGETITRGALCDIWIGVYFDINSNVNTTVQWYFTKKTWKEAVDTVIVPGSFFRMDIWQGGSTSPVIHNIHKYTPVTQPWAMFDYGECYSVDNRIHFVIQLLALDKIDINGISKPYLSDTMQEELASLIFEEPNRFSNILVEFDGGTSLYVSGLFLDKTPFPNYQLENRTDQHPLIPAYNFLKGHVEAQSLILITNIHGDPLRIQTKRIEQLSYSADFSTVTTHSTPTTVFRIPTIPVIVPTFTPPAPNTTQAQHTPSFIATQTPIHATPTLQTPPPLSAQHATSSTTRKTTRSITKRITWPFTPRRTTRTATLKPVISGCTCPPCNCPQRPCPSRPALQCPKQTVPSTVAPVIKLCPTQSQEKQPAAANSGISGGALAGAVIISLLLGAALCFLVLALISRRRELPLLQHRQEDTETIPLGNY